MHGKETKPSTGVIDFMIVTDGAHYKTYLQLISLSSINTYATQALHHDICTLSNLYQTLPKARHLCGEINFPNDGGTEPMEYLHNNPS